MIDEIWKAASTTRSMPVAMRKQIKKPHKEKRVDRLQFVHEKRRSDRKEDGWGLLSFGAGCAATSTAWISLFNDSQVLEFLLLICTLCLSVNLILSTAFREALTRDY